MPRQSRNAYCNFASYYISIMEKRKLGNTGIYIAPLALGTNVFGWTIDQSRSFEILDAFVDGGFNMIDTADSYSRWAAGNNGGESETIIGNWLKKTSKRSQVIIATKVGADMGDGRKGTSKAYIVKAVEDSLRRLQTDHIDLYQNHFDDGFTPVEETMEAFFQLIKDGKVIACGASNITPERLAQAVKTIGPPTKHSSHTTTSTIEKPTNAPTSTSAWKTISGLYVISL